MQKNNKITKAIHVAMMFGASAAVAISAPVFSAEEGDEKAALPIFSVNSEGILDVGLGDIRQLLLK